MLRDANGKFAGLGHNGATYFFSDYFMFSITNPTGTDTIDFACKNIYSMYHMENHSIILREAYLNDSAGVQTLNWNSGRVTIPQGLLNITSIPTAPDELNTGDIWCDTTD